MKHNQQIADLGPLLGQRGIRHVLISPGSRNAPLIQLFTDSETFVTHSVVDERSAGYVALGMARELKEPVALLSTSGTAVLNFSPSIAEAYRQQIPLLVLTADRPLEQIAQFNNQVINQIAPYFNHSKGFYEMPFEVRSKTELRQVMRSVAQLLDEALAPEAGPVHVNIPLLEPLYEPLPPPILKESLPRHPVSEEEEPSLRDRDVSALSFRRKIMVLAGMGTHGEELESFLKEAVKGRELVVIAENIANLTQEFCVANPELVLAGASEFERAQLAPEVVISFGGQVVSKRLRLFLETLEDAEYIELGGHAEEALKAMLEAHQEGIETTKNSFLESWKDIESRERAKAHVYLQKAPFSNLTAIEKVLSLVPAHAVIHLGNSSVIRYSQLSPPGETQLYYSNRGTSGIDGSVSAAVGAAMVSNSLHVLLVGDLSFTYDSNALWNKDFPGNLKIVVINDGGGGIFRLLEGPDRMEFFEEYSVTHHPVSLELLSQSFGREFRRAGDMEELIRHSEALFHPDSSLSILEIDTTKSENSRIFKQFFNLNQ